MWRLIAVVLVLAGAPTATRATAAAREEPPAPTCPTWYTLRHPSYPVKVWICGHGDAEAAKAQRVLQVVARYWPEMVKEPPNGMGTPLGDRSGLPLPATGRPSAENDEYDFYLLDRKMDLRRFQGTSLPIDDPGNPDDPDPAGPGGNPANTQQIADSRQPFGRAFTVIDASQIDARDFERSVVHELFHSLQFRWGTHVMYEGTKGFAWFTEASATWAETYYIQDRSELTHVAWYSGPPGFQHRPELSLLDRGPNDNHGYRVYPYFLFLEQELGGGARRNGQPIFKLWTQASMSAGFQDFHEAIDHALPFEAHFRDFAVRNLNLPSVLNSAGEKDFGQLDPRFPVNVPPTLADEGMLTTTRPTRVEINLSHLLAHYWKYSVEPGTRSITFDVSGIPGRAGLDIDLVAHQATGQGGAKWVRKRLSNPPSPLCLDDPEHKGLDQFYLVVTDHEREFTARPVQGFMVIRSAPSCEPLEVLVGSTGVTYNAKITNQQDDAVETTVIHASLTAKLKWVPPSGMSLGHWDTVGSHYVATLNHTIDNGKDLIATTTTSQGPWATGSFADTDGANVALQWLPDTSYSFAIPALRGAPNVSGLPAQMPTVAYGGAGMPPILAFHPHEATTRAGNEEYVENGMTVPGCRLTGDLLEHPTNEWEGRAIKQADGGYILDFGCSVGWREGSESTTVSVNGILRLDPPPPRR